jgi:Fe-S-cluster containining protein
VTFDFTPYFKEYEALVVVAEAIFDRVRDQYPECVQCRSACDDCCYAMFDVSLIEALYINHQFAKSVTGDARETLLEEANKADRLVHRIKRQAVKAVEAGQPESEVLTKLGAERVRCPLLSEERQCRLYAHRPITCRLYGIPTRIGDKAHTCSLSAFQPGESYPTVNLEPIQRRLLDISTRLVADIQSRFKGLGELLVPLSMALLTEYNAEYLGIDDEDGTGQPE